MNSKADCNFFPVFRKMEDSEPQSGGVFADIFPAEWAADGSGLKFYEFLLSSSF